MTTVEVPENTNVTGLAQHEAESKFEYRLNDILRREWRNLCTREVQDQENTLKNKD
jgi:hypothetical protein